DLRIVIRIGRLQELRTYGSGGRVPEDGRLDSPLHESIKQRSPVQAGDLVRKDELDAYVARLNRHPGRQVDYTLSHPKDDGADYLQFLVAENSPLTLYVQGSNTGTDETNHWRERFGLTDTQLTGHDDVLHLDFITGNFDQVFATFGSYEAPLGPFQRLRGRLGG